MENDLYCTLVKLNMVKICEIKLPFRNYKYETTYLSQNKKFNQSFHEFRINGPRLSNNVTNN